ncbi:MAG: hypothetical protein WD273_04790 [Trueperaceae bacterium]
MAEGALPAELQPGEHGVTFFGLRLDDPAAEVENAVLFLNVVLSDPGRNYPQAGHLVFSGASEHPSIFRKVLTGDQLRRGLETQLTFDTSMRAPPGEYVLVLQLFRGNRTNPHRLNVADRIGMVAFPFTVAEEN